MQFTAEQRHIHFVGIGGAGLSAIARVLMQRGYTVSGSDRTLSPITQHLADEGATIYAGHDAANIRGVDMVIISSAIHNNPEVEAALTARIPVYKRHDIMAALMEGRHVVAVAGTHGKTTTTAMIVHLLSELGLNPGYIVGGTMLNTGTNAADGDSKNGVFVIEADEYDNMFHGLRPDTIVLTSVEWDHPDFFKTEAEYFQSFDTFVGLLSPHTGALIACADDENAMRLFQHHAVPGSHTYSLEMTLPSLIGDHFFAEHIRLNEQGETLFDLYRRVAETETGFRAAPLPEGIKSLPEYLGTGRLALAGQHNILNALAALVVAHRLGETFPQALEALSTFKGTGRRFEVIGQAHGVTVISDYAHNPTKIRAALAAARSRYPDHHIWAVWQPHTYSRTLTMLDAFAQSFGDADAVVVTPIYAARETPPDGFDPASVVQAINHPSVYPTNGLEHAAELLLSAVERPAVIMIMSAGDAPHIGELFLAELVSP